MSRDPYKYFRIEARELLDQLGAGVLELERPDAAIADVVAKLLRAAHTLKGAARVVRELEIGDRSHAIEDLLERHRAGIEPVARERIDQMLGLVDAMSKKLALLGQPTEAVVAPTVAAPALASAAPVVATPAAPAAPVESVRTLRTELAEVDTLLLGITETQLQLATLQTQVTALERARQLSELLAEHVARAQLQGRTPSEYVARRTQALADDLRSSLRELARGVGPSVEQMERELQQTREAAERMRLMPVAALFHVLQRVTRDSAPLLGKRARFQGHGADVRLDAHVLESMQSALLQLVRNAVAHGIETEAERLRAGKPGEGSIQVSIARRGKHVVFVCEDDGRGMDLDAVRSAAARRGHAPAMLQALDADALLQLLLRGGISTAQAVNEVAGRGVGMDVVRDMLLGLRGEVVVQTQPGKGTRFELRVPLSLTGIDALIVEVGGQSAAIPLSAVRETLHLQPADIVHGAAGDSIMRGDTSLVFAPLARHLDPTAASSAAATTAMSGVIISHGATTLALGVDRLRGIESVVVHRVPDLTPTSAVIAGVALDARGAVRLVLDTEALIDTLARSAGTELSQPRMRLPILVVDDSLTTRMLEQSILESAGYEVDVACSGEEGLEKAQLRRYGLFLVDVEMPGIDGFTFVARTRADPVLRKTPAILVTSLASPESRRRGQEAGASAYIVKSEFDQRDLLARIQKLMEQQ